MFAKSVWYVLGGICVLGTVGGLGLRSDNPVFALALTVGCVLFSIFALANVLTGSTVAKWSNSMEAHCRSWLLRREARRGHVDLREFDWT